MRTIPEKMRTDEVYPAAFGSFIFINIGLTASKRGTRSCADTRRSARDVCRSCKPASERVVGAQVARGRRHEREAGLGTWVCEQRVFESEATTHGVREIPSGPTSGATNITASAIARAPARACQLVSFSSRRLRSGCSHTQKYKIDSGARRPLPSRRARPPRRDCWRHGFLYSRRGVPRQQARNGGTCARHSCQSH